MKISPRTAHHCQFLIGYPATFVAIVLAAQYRFAILISLITLLAVLLMACPFGDILCPNCRKPIGWGEYHLLGFKKLRIRGWRHRLPAACDRCHHDLRTKIPLKEVFHFGYPDYDMDYEIDLDRRLQPVFKWLMIGICLLTVAIYLLIKIWT